MCGRFTPACPEDIAWVCSYLYGCKPLAKPDTQQSTREDVFPHRAATIIYETAQHVPALSDKIWGFEPYPGGDLVFNTRLETAPTKALWAESLAERRCLVIVEAFFERQRRTQQLYRFTNAQHKLICIAGIWNDQRFSMMTVPPNTSMKPVHDRMPLVLSAEEAPLWMAGTWDKECMLDRSHQQLVAQPIARPSRHEAPGQLHLFDL